MDEIKELEAREQALREELTEVRKRLREAAKKPLTQARLKELFYYDIEGGSFYRLLNNKITGTKAHNGYLVINIDGKQHATHRLAFLYVNGEWPVNYVDHINHIRDDNRWSNLREATHSENHMNRRSSKASTEGVSVSLDKRSRLWRAKGTDSDGFEVDHGAFESHADAVASLKREQF